jgi:integrase
MASSAKAQRTELIDRLYGINPKVRIERRNGSPRFYARVYLDGKWRVTNTGEETPAAAKRVAEKWYLDLLIAQRAGDLPTLPGGPAPVLFEKAYESFIAHADRTRYPSEGQRKNYRQKWTLLKPHFEGVSLADIDRAWLETLRNTRKDSTEIVDSEGRRRKRTKPVSNGTLKKDADFIRLVLRHAKEIDKTLDALPQFPPFKGRAWKVKPTMRPYLPYPLWKKVRDTAKARIHEHVTTNRLTAARVRKQRAELYSFICLCVGAALRVDEAKSLRWKDCELGRWDDGTEYVHLWVYGKHADAEGVREEGWALYDGVVGFKMLQKLYPDAEPESNLFREYHRDAMKDLLKACGANVREDLATAMTRDAKSLRQTGISMRLEMGPDPSYNDIAKWARTSPVQIAKFYDQTHPENAVKRIAGFRKTGDAVLDRHREQMLKDSTADTDDFMGEDQETGDEPWDESV